MVAALIAAGAVAVSLLAAPLLIADPVLRHAWLAADGAALLAVMVALPLAVAMWQLTGVGKTGAGKTGAGKTGAGKTGAGLVALGGVVVALAGLAGLPAAFGLPVAVLALAARLRQVPKGTLRIAAVSGLSSAACWRLVLAPLLAPAMLGGFLIVFAAVLADGLGVAPVSLPMAAMAAWLMWMLLARG